LHHRNRAGQRQINDAGGGKNREEFEILPTIWLLNASRSRK
jgi:hypothetical protein